MKINIFIICFCFLLVTPFISTTEFIISSYNCGGLSNHYDYLRSAAMQKLMQERYNAEPEKMFLNERIQQLALKILFANGVKKENAEREWNENEYDQLYKELTAAPFAENSPNAIWNKKANEIITDYKTRPVSISDEELGKILIEHVSDFTDDKEIELNELLTKEDLLTKVRDRMAEKTFSSHLKYDIICLQEGDYLQSFVDENHQQQDEPLKNKFFPKNYEVLFADSTHSKNGIAWNTDRFKLLENIGDHVGRTYIVKLQDIKTNKVILVASAHLSGCNPYQKIITESNDTENGIIETSDSDKGDNEIIALLNTFESIEADIKLIGMDSNVTSLHPRLEIIKNADFKLDYENFIESTCTNPYQVLNTRIDWIAVQSNIPSIKITNIPVLNVGLNSIQTNMSDHKPIAAKIKYADVVEEK